MLGLLGDDESVWLKCPVLPMHSCRRFLETLNDLFFVSTYQSYGGRNKCRVNVLTLDLLSNLYADLCGLFTIKLTRVGFMP